MSTLGWWRCPHTDIGLPGCPTCDGRLDDVARAALREALAEITRLVAEVVEGNDAGDRLDAQAVGMTAAFEALEAERDTLRAQLAAAEATIARLNRLAH